MKLYDPSYSVVSLFCGLGGLDLGFSWEGFNLIWANDISANAVKSHQRNFGTPAICADITNYPLKNIPDADVIIGGPPCQSFSLLGQRNFNDPRGRLVFRFLDIIKAKRPKAFVMENVPGMAASMVGRVRLTDHLMSSFIELGYTTAKFNLLASDFLVPQRRRRIILVGILGGNPTMISGEAFSKLCYGRNPLDSDISAMAAIGDLGSCTDKGDRASYLNKRPSRFAALMRSAALPDVSLHELPRMSQTDRLLVRHIPPGGNYTDIPDDLSTGRILKFKESGGRTTTYGRLHHDRPAYTINTYFRRPNVGCNFHYCEERLITPREAMRFQSIPDHFEVVFSSQDERNALIGNAVPPLLARALAISVKSSLNMTDAEPQPRALCKVLNKAAPSKRKLLASTGSSR